MQITRFICTVLFVCIILPNEILGYDLPSDNVINQAIDHRQIIHIVEGNETIQSPSISSTSYNNNKHFRSRITNNINSGKYTIVFNNHFVDSLEVNLTNGQNRISHLSFLGAARGDKHYIDFNFPSGDTYDLTIHVINKAQFDIPVYIYETETFYKEKFRQTLINGIFFGAYVLFLIYALISALVTRKRIYFLLIGYIIFSNIYHLAEHGVKLPFNIGEQALFASIFIGLPFMIQISHELLSVRKFEKTFNTIHKVLLGVCAVFIIVTLTGVYDSTFTIFRITYESLSIIGIVSYAYVLLRAVFYQTRPLMYRILLFGYFALCIGFLIKPLSFLGFLHYGTVSKYSAMFGQLIELISLTGYLILDNYINIKQSNKIKEEMRSLEQSALQAQMNPHFIFNCLNSIQNFIMDNEKIKAMDYLSRFAKLVRQNLNASVNSTISIAEEIEMLQTYLDLEKLRHKDSFQYSITVDPSIRQASTFIDPLLIQPFVENAIKHGVSDLNEGKIDIKLEQSGNFIKANITDNGLGINKDKVSSSHQSLGMNITNKRLKYINNYDGDGYTIKTNTEGSGTIISITIKANNIPNTA